MTEPSRINNTDDGLFPLRARVHEPVAMKDAPHDGTHVRAFSKWSPQGNIVYWDKENKWWQNVEGREKGLLVENFSHWEALNG